MHIENRTLLPANMSWGTLRPPEVSKFSSKVKTETTTMTASPSPVDYREMEVSPNHGLLLADEQQTSDILEPHHNDVLCGRGVTTNRHPGNESFRRLVSLNKELYVTSTKRQKMAISRSIVEAVRTLDPPGRFLDKDPVTGRWFEVGHKKAVEKTSQALRDGAASLRKQLSADLGDPDFLNAVFHADGEEEDKSEKSDENKNEKETKPEDAPSAKVKKSPDEKSTKIKEKVKATAKTKQPKAKEAPVKAKKGHRRTRSTPIIGSVTAAKRVQRRSPPTEPPPSPIARMSENFCHEPPSPHSPPPRHSASHPNSPMTWGGRIRFDEGQSPGSLGSIPRHSPYEPPASPHPSPHFSPYGHPPGPYRGGHSGYEYHGSHREHPPYQWPNKPSRYQNYPGHPSPTARPPPMHSSPAPHSPLPSGPLPPGRHKFSPSGYQTNSHPSEYHRSEHPPPEYHRSEHPPPEWSPRMVHRHHSRYPSPRHYSPHYSGEYQSAHSPRWRGHPPPQDSYSSGEYSNSSLNSSSLSVPALGGEGKPHVSSSPRLMLSPRSHHSAYNQIPPRPPSSYSHKEFMPPSQPSFSSDDFSPPPPSPRYRQSNRHNPFASASEEKSRSSRSSPVEEKKSDMGEREDRNYSSPDNAPGSAPLSSLSNTRGRRSPTRSMDKDMEDKKVRIKRDDSPDEARPKDDQMYPYDATKDDDDPALEDNNSVDDIQMSPIPLDREDPSTLMELPENIMILPISPCGPKDA